MTGPLTLAIATAIATTFDDNIYLTLLFGKTDRTFRPRHVIVGEFVGFSVLIALSLIGYLGGMIVSSMWLGLLGVLPIMIGLSQLLNREEDDATVQTVSTPAQARRRSSTRSGKPSLWDTLRDPQTYRVSAVTIANGGNNLGIYIPLFASSTFPNLMLTIAVCYLAIGIWCCLSYAVVRQPGIAFLMTRYVRKVVPFALIWIGFSIFQENQSYELFAGLF